MLFNRCKTSLNIGKNRKYRYHLGRFVNEYEDNLTNVVDHVIELEYKPSYIPILWGLVNRNYRTNNIRPLYYHIKQNENKRLLSIPFSKKRKRGVVIHKKGRYH